MDSLNKYQAVKKWGIESMIKFSIPIVTLSLNKWYAGSHWAKRKQVADLWHDTIWKICRIDKIEPIAKFPVTIITKSYFKSKRKKDVSNLFPANKLAEDGLVKAGILPDDTVEYVERHIIETPVFGHSEDVTVIEILSSNK